jgi:putative membrane protein
MRGLLIRFLVSALALGATSYIVPGFHRGSVSDLLVAALILGVLNAIIRPILILLTLPINLLTLGLFTFVINAGMLKLTDYLVKGFQIDGFIAALIGAVVLSIISALINWLVKDAREKRRHQDD